MLNSFLEAMTAGIIVFMNALKTFLVFHAELFALVIPVIIVGMVISIPFKLMGFF